MTFEYISSNGKTESINIAIGYKWGQLNFSNSILNTIFSKIDDGDGIKCSALWWFCILSELKPIKKD